MKCISFYRGFLFYTRLKKKKYNHCLLLLQRNNNNNNEKEIITKILLLLKTLRKNDEYLHVYIYTIIRREGCEDY